MALYRKENDMARYRKKPVTIEAFQLGIDYIPDWFMDKVTTNEIILHGTSSGFDHHDDTNADIKTLEGWMHANSGDFIIKGVAGEIYPCKPDIFRTSYESADTTADVVPKSECNRCAERTQKSIGRLQEQIANTKAEVAREIFEEIEKHLFVIAPIEEFDGWAKIQLCDILRIKKKYTEGNDE